MNCKDYREQFPLMLTGDLDPAGKDEIERHLESCAECRLEFESSAKVWELMGEIEQPEPSGTMRAGFDALLSNYKEELIARRNPVTEWINMIREYWSLKARPRLAFSALLVIAGLALGYILHNPVVSTISNNKQIESLSSQVSEMKQVLMLSLLQDPSASQRIEAVSYTDEIKNVDTKVINALLTTLNEDPNVNVRLATLEALAKIADDSRVREGLVRSISSQDSPIMQSAIADIMVKLQVKSSVQPLQKLLSKKDLNQMVKIKIEKSIQKLI